jgi:hypothetical protein
VAVVVSRRAHGLGTAGLLLALWPSLAFSQGEAARTVSLAPVGSVEVVAGARYEAGGFHRFLLGSDYRDLWTEPLLVPVLNLRTFAGGLRPLKESGGNQTRSLRFVSTHGAGYVFRSVNKSGVSIPPGFKGTVVEAIARDQGSAAYPAAALVTAPILEAAGVLHVTPTLVVMPDDPLLGEFRAEFAGRLGMIEEYPGTPDEGPGFAGATKIIDSDELLALLDHDPSQQVDARALLTARLTDMLLNDWDRHQGQWKWARMRPGHPTAWTPIARDRDKDFISYGGALPALARLASPNVMEFDSTYPSIRGLTWNSLAFDRRLLDGLEKPAWDSVASALVQRLTDSVIDAAVHALPPAYAASAPALAGKLKSRRDGLPEIANRFYLLLAPAVDIHATDAADRATVTRMDDGVVEVRLDSGTDGLYYLRRFDARDTREIRIYLHGNDDSALVTGDVRGSITVRIIGGDGSNVLTDSSRVNGADHPTHLYDDGIVSGISYGPDTLFDRRPWIGEAGKSVAPGPDEGKRLRPNLDFSIGDLGVLFGLGVGRDRYGFRRRPYADRVSLQAEYATGVNGFRIGVAADHRLESSSVHFAVLARMSQLQLTNYYGIGNTTAGTPAEFYQVRQQQWLLQPAVALGDDRRAELSFGPVVQYAVTDSNAQRYVTTSQPYGSGEFGQAGLRLNLSHDGRDQAANPHRGALLDLTGAFYPAIWNVTSPFGAITVTAATYLTLPIPLRPVLALRGGGRKVFGTSPFQESAFVGGRSSVRILVPQRYAGDGSLSGTAELRIPLAHFAFVLPLDLGLFGFFDVGRVYVDGDSPGGWHTAAGGGLWLGILNPSTALTVTVASGAGQTEVLLGTGLTF